MNYNEFKERVFNNKYDVPLAVYNEIESWYIDSKDSGEKNVFCATHFGFGITKAAFAVRFAIQKTFRLPSNKIDFREIEVGYCVEDVLEGEGAKKIESAKKEARRQIRIVFPRREKVESDVGPA